MTGSSTQAIKTVLHPVSDPATAKKVYTALLGEPAHDVRGGRLVATAKDPDGKVLGLVRDR